ncbi:MAG: SsrA-binding protein SmpB [Phycisphaerae bacterium]
MASQAPDQRRIVNKKARHQYHIIDTVEAGIVLTGCEVRSIREGRAQITDGFVRINGYEATLYGCQIDRYEHSCQTGYDPKRKRRLLLHRREIRRLSSQVAQKGYTLIPISIYFNSRGLAKVELALATGKEEHDKRENLRKRQHQRDMDRATGRRR